MSKRVKTGTFKQSCRTCGWAGVYATAARGDYAKRRHSCALNLAKREATARGIARTEAVDRTPKPCLHKQTTHTHGTYACYVLDRCRCLPCKDATTEYERNRVRKHAYGRFNDWVDAQPARDHVAQLVADGMGLKTIALTPGISHGQLWKLMYGKTRADGTRKPSARIHRTTETKILAVKLRLADSVNVDSSVAVGRVRALIALGYSKASIGHRLGMNPSNFGLFMERDRCLVRTAKNIHRLYLELAEKPPVAANRWQQGAINRSIRFAEAKGWRPPLRINGRLHVGPPWGADELPAPVENPARRVEARVEARREDIEWLIASCEPPHEIAKRLDMTLDSLIRWCERSAPDLTYSLQPSRRSA